jgi:uncharacterized protein YihD (DUF1040 family)
MEREATKAINKVISKLDSYKQKETDVDLDEILYEARHVRGLLRVLADIDEGCIASYGYHELLQVAYLTKDSLDKAIEWMDKDVIGKLMAAGAA